MVECGVNEPQASPKDSSRSDLELDKTRKDRLMAQAFTCVLTVPFTSTWRSEQSPI